MLVDGRVKINVMTIFRIRYLRLKIDIPTLITLKMVNKWVDKLKGVINSVAITVMGVTTLVDFHVILEEDGLTQ
jgi:hypothetical protein